MSAERSPLNEDERAELVAYLDGELDGEAARALEAKLNIDPGARAEAEELRRTWDLLDYLPRPEPSPSFTHRTLERLSPLTQSALVTRTRQQRRPWVLAMGWAAALLLASAAGFGGATLFRTRETREPSDQELVRDLRIIENKRLYEQVDDIEFLRKLSHPDLFGEDDLGS